MTHLRRVLLALLAVALGACAKTEPPPRFAPPNPARSDAAPLDAAELDTLEAIDTSPAAAAASPSLPEPPEPAAPVPRVDDELCRSACENALSVTLAELPESAIASMRDELTRALKDDCPARCVAKASLESARCIASAKSALALASCP